MSFYAMINHSSTLLYVGLIEGGHIYKYASKAIVTVASFIRQLPKYFKKKGELELANPRLLQLGGQSPLRPSMLQYLVQGCIV